MNNDSERINDFIQLNDSSIYFTGTWRNCGSCEYYPLLGLANNEFIPTWTFIYSDTAIARRILLLNDGILVFGSDLGTPVTKYFLLKTDFNGVPIWSTAFGSDYDNHGVICSSDDGYLICGSTHVIDSLGNDSTLLNIISLSDTGTILWSRSYSISKYFSVNGINYLPDSTFMISGRHLNPDSVFFSSALLKISMTGDILWLKNYSISGKDLMFTSNLINYSNSFYCGGGVTFNSVEYPSIFGFDDTGNVKLSVSFIRPLGGPSPYYLNTHHNNSSFIMTFGQGILVTDSLGNFIESHTYIPNHPANSQYYKFTQLSDNGLLLGGLNSGGNNDIFVVKTDSFYNGGCGFYDLSFNPMIENINTTVLPYQEVNLNVNVYQRTFNQDTLLLTSNTFCFTATTLDEIHKPGEMTILPNPAHEYFKISILNENIEKSIVVKIYNSTGRLISENLINSSTDLINVNHLPQGIYCIQIEIEKAILNKKFVKL